MKKSFLILILLIIGLLTVSSVSAVDNLTDESINVSNNVEVEIQNDIDSDSENLSFIDDAEDISKENSSNYNLVLQNNDEEIFSSGLGRSDGIIGLCRRKFEGKRPATLVC